MSGVQRAHRGCEGDALARRPHAPAPVTGLGPRAGDHQSGTLGQILDPSTRERQIRGSPRAFAPGF